MLLVELDLINRRSTLAELETRSLGKLSNTLNNGRKSIRAQRRSQTMRFQKTMISGVLRAMISQTHTETRGLVDLATLWALFRLPILD
jgi:hypothetical protein